MWSSAKWIICYPIISDREKKDFHEGIYADYADGDDDADDVDNADDDD